MNNCMAIGAQHIAHCNFGLNSFERPAAPGQFADVSGFIFGSAMMKYQCAKVAHTANFAARIFLEFDNPFANSADARLLNFSFAHFAFAAAINFAADSFRNFKIQSGKLLSAMQTRDEFHEYYSNLNAAC